jgi:hypothetical protein
MDITHSTKITPYNKGKNVLVESLCLSKTNKAIIVNSNVSAASRIFNPNLQVEYIDTHCFYY